MENMPVVESQSGSSVEQFFALLDETYPQNSQNNYSVGSVNDVEDVSNLPQVQIYENSQNDIYFQPPNNTYTQQYQPEDMSFLGDNEDSFMYQPVGYDLQAQYAPIFEDNIPLANFQPIYEQPNIVPVFQPNYDQENVAPIYEQMYEPQQENIPPNIPLPTYNESFGGMMNSSHEYVPPTPAYSENCVKMLDFENDQSHPVILEVSQVPKTGSTSQEMKELMLHDNEGNKYPVKIQVRTLQEANKNYTNGSLKQYMLVPFTGPLPEDCNFKYIDLKAETIHKINTVSQGKSILLSLGVENARTVGRYHRITRRTPVKKSEVCSDEGISSSNNSPVNLNASQEMAPLKKNKSSCVKSVFSDFGRKNKSIIPSEIQSAVPMEYDDPVVPYRKQIRKRKQSFDKLQKDEKIIIEDTYRLQRTYTANSEGLNSTDEEPSLNDDQDISQMSKRSKTETALASISQELNDVGKCLVSTAVIFDGSQEFVVAKLLPEAQMNEQKNDDKLKEVEDSEIVQKLPKKKTETKQAKNSKMSQKAPIKASTVTTESSKRSVASKSSKDLSKRAIKKRSIIVDQSKNDPELIEKPPKKETKKVAKNDAISVADSYKAEKDPLMIEEIADKSGEISEDGSVVVDLDNSRAIPKRGKRNVAKSAKRPLRSPKSTKENKLNQCPTCKKWCRSNDLLMKHLQTHTAKKPNSVKKNKSTQ